MRRGFFILIILVCLAWPGTTQAALPRQSTGPIQPAARAALSTPDTSNFPQVSVYLQLQAADGGFMPALQREEVQVLEDGQPVEVGQVEEQRPGVQFVLGINLGISLGIRNSQGVSRYDMVKEALQEWAHSRQASTVDDLSLLVSDGAEALHLSSPAEWLGKLDSYPYNAQVIPARPTLDVLSRALDVASDPSPRLGMGRAVLLVTSPLDGDLSFSVQDLGSRAQAQGVRFYIWLVASPEQADLPPAVQLRDLALQTGGQFLNFSGTEAFPDLEQYLSPLRSIYHLVYTSQILSSDTHQLVVEIERGAEKITTPPQNFSFSLLPPEAVLISPPMVIERLLSEDASRNILNQADPSDLLPAVFPLELLVDFPDGHPREVVSATLYVDGVLQVQDTTAPFDRFNWDLRAYAQNGQHVLKLVVEDAYGLVGSSVDTLVEVQVAELKQSPWNLVVQRGPLVAGLAIVLSGALLLMGLILGGRLHPLPRIGARAQRQREHLDPRAQPVPEGSGHRLPGEAQRTTSWLNRLQWPQRRMAPKAFAFLHRLAETNPTENIPPFSVTAEELTIGTDPHRAVLALEDASVEGLHARLVRQPDGAFCLSDEGSIAGTWINYAPVSREGALLESGDLIHIGRVGFRFVQRETLRQRSPVVTTLEPAQEIRGQAE